MTIVPLIRPVSPRPPDGGRDDRDLTVDDIFMLIVATAAVVGLLALIGLGSVSSAARTEAAITRLAS